MLDTHYPAIYLIDFHSTPSPTAIKNYLRSIPAPSLEVPNARYPASACLE